MILLGGKLLLSKLFKHFRRKEDGSVAFEVIWCGLFVSFFFAPTMYLYQHSIAGLESSWGIRSAARSQAMNLNCLGLAVPIPLSAGLRYIDHVKSQTGIGCIDVEGEAVLPTGERFWNKMDDFDSGFSNFTQSFLTPGKLKAVKSAYAWNYGKFGLGGTDDPMYENAFSNLPTTAAEIQAAGEVLLGVRIKTIEVPGGDTWQFEKSPWKDGHDPIFHSSLPTSKSKTLYEKVFPAR